MSTPHPPIHLPPLRSNALRRVALVTSALSILLLPSIGDAAPPDDEVRPPTWDMSLDELRAIGLGQYRGDPIPVPPEYARERDPDEPPQAKQGVIFVNFDGAQLSSGPDNSKTNTTQIGQLAGNFAAYGQGSKREATLQAVREDWSPFNVIVVDSRPATGDYTMNMTGPTNPFGGGVLGIAPLDCNDSQTHNNITFAFHSANDQFSASTQATTIGQEVAHSYGLEHVDEPGDIMNPYNAGGDPSFRDECIQIVSNQGIVCGSQHAAQCGSSNMQNSYRELLALFGPAQADEAPPEVAITYPMDGATFDVGADFDITATATDDVAVASVDLYVNGAFQQSDGSEPYSWGVTNIPAGTYEIYVVAKDLAGNETMSDVVTIGVGEAPPTTTSGSGGDSGGDSGGGTSGGDSGGTSDGGGTAADSTALPPGFGEDGGDEGCGCATNRSPAGAALGWLLMGALWVGRRRS